MKEELPFHIDDQVQATLDQLLDLLEKSEVIQAYKQIEARVRDHQGLIDLVEEIKAYQKEAVKAAHYGKPEAEKQAIKKADELTATFDQHPLVLRYRQRLIEANDLLQHITNLLERTINIRLALEYEDLFKQKNQEK